jgi:hypothetical protein
MDAKDLFKLYVELFYGSNVNEINLITEQLNKLGCFVLSDGKFLRLLPNSSGYNRKDINQATIAKSKIRREVGMVKQ